MRPSVLTLKNGLARIGKPIRCSSILPYAGEDRNDKCHQCQKQIAIIGVNSFDPEHRYWVLEHEGDGQTWQNAHLWEVFCTKKCVLDFHKTRVAKAVK